MDLDSIIKMIAGAVTTIGGIMAAWGGVQVGMGLNATHGQATGADLGPGIAAIAGGFIIVASAVYLGYVDTSWAK